MPVWLGVDIIHMRFIHSFSSHFNEKLIPMFQHIFKHHHQYMYMCKEHICSIKEMLARFT